MALTPKRPGRLRRALAVGAVLALPLGVAACADDETDEDTGIVNETPTETPTEDPLVPEDTEPTDDPMAPEEEPNDGMDPDDGMGPDDGMDPDDEMGDGN